MPLYFLVKGFKNWGNSGGYGNGPTNLLSALRGFAGATEPPDLLKLRRNGAISRLNS